MSTWKIKTLYYGTTCADRRHLANGLDAGLVMEGPYLGFLLQDGHDNILVDSGIHDRMIVDGKAWGGNPATGGEKFVLDALEKAGVTPKDISTVIYTHLHNDHAGNCLLFPEARSIYQKDEYYNLLDPLPTQRMRLDYDLAVADDMMKLKNKFMIDGDFELPNGIKMIKTPGHSSGSMVVVVPTDDGPRIITGDMPHMPYNLFPQHDKIRDMNGEWQKITPAPLEWGRFLPTSITYDHYAFYDSLDKIRLLAPEFDPKYYIFGHDPGALFDYPNG